MQPFQKTLTIVQVIMITMAAGLIILSGIMIYMVHQVQPGGFLGPKGPELGPLPLITTTLAGTSLLVLILALILPAFILNTQLTWWKKQAQPVQGEFSAWETTDLAWLDRVPSETLTSLLGIFHNNKIMTVALFEGAGMLSAMAYLLEAHWFALTMLILSIVLMLAKVPTQATLNTWLFTQIEQLRRDSLPSS